MTERRRQYIEAVGGLLIVAGLATVSIVAALIVAGALLILAANFADLPKEPDDANPE